MWKEKREKIKEEKERKKKIIIKESNIQQFEQ